MGSVVSLASGIDVPVLTRLQNLEQISAIERDAKFHGGHYKSGDGPEAGLALARMIQHKTFVCMETLVDHVRNDIEPAENFTFYDIAHPVESYMYHQGEKFVKRFDANTYLRILDAWNNFDLAREARAQSLSDAFGRSQDQRWLIVSIDSDACYYPSSQKAMATLLKEAGVPHQLVTVHSEKGHDAVLLQPELFTPHLSWFLGNGNVKLEASL